MENFFEQAISTYTDRDAIEDGAIVAINPRDRVTRAVWDWLETGVDMKNPKPPNCWPVDLFPFFGAKKPATRVLAMCRGLIDTHRRPAERAEANGKTYALWCECVNLRPAAIHEAERPGAKELWLIPNEARGFTLMFPGDY